jgi:hypothetical protein
VHNGCRFIKRLRPIEDVRWPVFKIPKVSFFPIETIMETDNDKSMMTVQAASRVRKDHPEKKSAERHKTPEDETKNALYSISEHSLSGFLENEPDIYSVSDLKVRYR